MKKPTITRQEIYDLVWKEPLTSLSIRLNISYTHLKKVCWELSIPIPPTRYWIRKRYAKTDDKIPLPTAYSGVNEINLYPVINDLGAPKELTFHNKLPIPLDSPDSPFPFQVSKRLTDPDPFVVAAQKQLERKQTPHYHHSDMIRSSGAITIRVREKNVGRALRFTDAFIKMIRGRGHIIGTGWAGQLNIDGENYEVKLIEIAKKGESDRLRIPTFKGTGVLSFSIYGIQTNTWKDGRAPIEDRLPDILAKLEATINYWKEYRGKQAEENRLLEEKERIIREQRECIEKEKADFEDLYQQAKRWQRARTMREYITAYEKDAIDKGGLTDEVREWIRWAKDTIDRYDSLMETNDPILD